MAYDNDNGNELNEWRREQAFLRAESETEEGRLRLLNNSGDLDDDENEEGDGEDAATGRVSGYMPDDTYDEDDDDIELDDPESDLTDDDISEPISDSALPTAEYLDAVADEQSIADATSTSHPATDTPSPAAKPKTKKKSKSVRKPKPGRVSKSGVKRPPTKPKKGKSAKTGKSKK